jgi:hypothetical protein
MLNFNFRKLHAENLHKTHNCNKCRISKEEMKDSFCGGDEKYTKTLAGKSELKDHLDNLGINKIISSG